MDALHDEGEILEVFIESANDPARAEAAVHQYSKVPRLLGIFHEAISQLVASDSVMNLARAVAKRCSFALAMACEVLYEREEVETAEICETEIREMLEQLQGEARQLMYGRCAGFLAKISYDHVREKIKTLGGDDWRELQMETAHGLLTNEQLEKARELAEEAAADDPNLARRLKNFNKRYRVKKREAQATPLPDDVHLEERQVSIDAQKAYKMAERGQIIETNAIWENLLAKCPADSARAFLRFSKKYNTKENNPSAARLIGIARTYMQNGEIDEQAKVSIMRIGKNALEAQEWLQRAEEQFSRENFQEGAEILEKICQKSLLRKSCIEILRKTIKIHGIQCMNLLPITVHTADLLFAIISEYKERLPEDCSELCIRIAKTLPRSKHVCATLLLGMGKASKGLLLLTPIQPHELHLASAFLQNLIAAGETELANAMAIGLMEEDSILVFAHLYPLLKSKNTTVLQSCEQTLLGVYRRTTVLELRRAIPELLRLIPQNAQSVETIALLHEVYGQCAGTTENTLTAIEQEIEDYIRKHMPSLNRGAAFRYLLENTPHTINPIDTVAARVMGAKRTRRNT